MKTKIAFFCVIYMCAYAYSTTFYVATDGNDTNSGTLSEPWYSIQSSIQKLNRGDTLLVKPGNYDENINTSKCKSGIADSLITIKSEIKHEAITKGFIVSKSEFIVIDGFQIKEVTESWRRAAIWIESNNIIISNNYIHSFEYCGIKGTHIKEKWSHNIKILNNKMYKLPYGIIVNGNNWEVDSNVVERLFCYRDDGKGDCDYARFFGDGIKFRNNYFFGTKDEETGKAHVDGFQTFDNGGSFARNVLIENNLVCDMDQGMMCSEVTTDTSMYNFTIKNNIFIDANAWGMSMMGIRNIKVYNNLFINIKYHGVGFSQGANGEVINNIFINTGSSYWAHDSSTVIGDYNCIYQSKTPHKKGEHDTTGIDPLITFNKLKKTFEISPNSVIIDNGQYLKEVSKDIYGQERPLGNNHDIGPFETPKNTLIKKSDFKSHDKLNYNQNFKQNNYQKMYDLKGRIISTPSKNNFVSAGIKIIKMKNSKSNYKRILINR